MSTQLLLLPLAATVAGLVAFLAGALAARQLRRRTNYAPRVVAGLIAPWLVPAAALGFISIIAAAIAALLLLCAASGATVYVRTRWAQDAGVGELGAMHREREGIRALMRDRVDSSWRARDLDGLGHEVVTEDGARCRLGAEIHRRDARQTGDVVTVKLGTRRGGANFGIVGLLLGRPGSGKTTTAIRLLHASATADPGGVVLIIDPKGDPDLRAAGQQIAAQHGTRFWEWTADSPLDPLGTSLASPGLAVQAAVARVMAAMEFTEPHYEGIALDAYTDAAQLLALLGEPLSLQGMAEFLSPAGASACLRRAAARVKTDAIARDDYEDAAAWLTDQNDRKTWSGLSGAATRLKMLARTGLGAQLAAEQEGGRTISDIASTPGVAYLHLDAGMWPDAAKQMAELLAVALMQDVGRIAANSSHTITLFIDEVGAVPARRMDAMLQRGRSAGFSVILAAQTLAGIGAVTPELSSQITGTLSWLIGHGSIGQSEGGEDDAERIARLAGTRIEHELTTQTGGGMLAIPTGQGSARQVDSYILHPNRIRSLPRGHAVVVDVDALTSDPHRGRLCHVAPYAPPPAPVALDPARASIPATTP